MKIYKLLYSTLINFLMAFPIACLLWLNSSAALSAQENDFNMAKAGILPPVARNSWEEIYFLIADNFRAPDLIELLKSMELEPDQAALASSYAIILEDQLYSHATRLQGNPVYRERIIGFLLDKIAEQAEAVNNENPEIANVIALNLIPRLDYDALMGKANYTLGHLGATDFTTSIIRRLEDIYSIVLVGGNIDYLGLNYAASGCLDALMEFKEAAAAPVLLAVEHGRFDQEVKAKAKRLLELLKKEKTTQIQTQLVSFISETRHLMPLNMLADWIDEGEFASSDKAAATRINLALLTRMNEATWSVSPLGSSDVKIEILQKTINNFVTEGAEGFEKEVSEQLKQSYLDSRDMDVKLLALEAIGIFKSKEGLKLLQDEIFRLNVAQHSDFINDRDERILYRLMYSLGASKDSSERTVAALRNVSMSPYASAIRKTAKDILSNIS